MAPPLEARAQESFDHGRWLLGLEGKASSDYLFRADAMSCAFDCSGPILPVFPWATLAVIEEGDSPQISVNAVLPALAWASLALSESGGSRGAAVLWIIPIYAALAAASIPNLEIWYPAGRHLTLAVDQKTDFLPWAGDKWHYETGASGMIAIGKAILRIRFAYSWVSVDARQEGPAMRLGLGFEPGSPRR